MYLCAKYLCFQLHKLKWGKSMYRYDIVSDEQSISIHQISKTCIGNKHFNEHQDCFEKSISFNYHKIKIERLNGAGKTALISMCTDDEDEGKPISATRKLFIQFGNISLIFFLNYF